MESPYCKDPTTRRIRLEGDPGRRKPQETTDEEPISGRSPHHPPMETVNRLHPRRRADRFGAYWWNDNHDECRRRDDYCGLGPASGTPRFSMWVGTRTSQIGGSSSPCSRSWTCWWLTRSSPGGTARPNMASRGRSSRGFWTGWWRPGVDIGPPGAGEGGRETAHGFPCAQARPKQS